MKSIVDSVGFYDVHKFAKMKKKDIVPIEQFIIEGKSQGHISWDGNKS
jgi:hypothetical protein